MKAGDWQCPSCQANNCLQERVFPLPNTEANGNANATSNSAYLATNNVSGGSEKEEE